MSLLGNNSLSPPFFVSLACFLPFLLQPWSLIRGLITYLGFICPSPSPVSFFQPREIDTSLPFYPISLYLMHLLDQFYLSLALSLSLCPPTHSIIHHCHYLKLLVNSPTSCFLLLITPDYIFSPSRTPHPSIRFILWSLTRQSHQSQPLMSRSFIRSFRCTQGHAI